jgi:hypothetical protein
VKTKTDIAKEYCSKYPTHPSLTIARLLLKEEPLLFLHLEAARKIVKYARGLEKNGSGNKTPFPVPNPVVPQQPFASLPEGISHFADKDSLDIPNGSRALLLADAHIPFHDKPALVKALCYGIEWKPTHVILNGDTADFFSVSFWEKDPRKRNLAGEIQTVRDFLATLREHFPDQEIIFKLGNHEERWERFLSVKAPELLGVADFEIEKILRFDNHGIVGVRDMRPIRMGHLNVIHGHEFRWGIQSPVNPARGFYLRGKECCIGGHLHQSSSHTEKSMTDKVVQCWSTGCLCDMKPDYARFNKWNHGFATVETDADGMFEVQNWKIVNDRLYPT